jgi:polar amino acid transport system permease protein
MSFATAMRRVIIPQAVVAMIPPWGNLFIELLKSTSLVSMITVADLTFRAQQLNQFTFKTVPIFTLVLLIYLVIAVLITFGFRTLEGRASQGMRRKS